MGELAIGYDGSAQTPGGRPVELIDIEHGCSRAFDKVRPCGDSGSVEEVSGWTVTLVPTAR